MFVGMNRQEQGDKGELSAMSWYVGLGCSIYVPVGHSPDADFIADDGVRLIRVQVKTCGYREKDRWAVTICTRGGNQSWSGLVKRFTAARCDALFVVTVDGRRWCIPADAVEGTTKVFLGGRKYAEFEVEPGSPLSASQAPQTLRCPTPAG